MLYFLSKLQAKVDAMSIGVLFGFLHDSGKVAKLFKDGTYTKFLEGEDILLILTVAVPGL